MFERISEKSGKKATEKDSIEVTEKYFKSSSKVDNNVRYLIWENKSASPIGVIQIAHGVQEYIDRYDDFARFLVSKGYIVCGNDHLGHGKTAGLDTLGITPPDAAKCMVSDMHKLYMIMHKKYANLPYIMFGHSMGSYLARSYTAKYGKELSAAIYCGSCYVPSWGVLLQPIFRIMEKIHGPDHTDSKMSKLTARIANAGIRRPKSVSDWLSYNKDNVNKFLSDPYCGGDMSSSLTRDAVAVVTNGGRRGWQKKIPKNLPVLIISGESDSCGMFGYGTSLLYTQLAKADVDTTFALYKARHEILNDNTKDEVYDDVANWLSQKVLK